MDHRVNTLSTADSLRHHCKLGATGEQPSLSSASSSSSGPAHRDPLPIDCYSDKCVGEADRRVMMRSPCAGAALGPPLLIVPNKLSLSLQTSHSLWIVPNKTLSLSRQVRAMSCSTSSTSSMLPRPCTSTSDGLTSSHSSSAQGMCSCSAASDGSSRRAPASLQSSDIALPSHAVRSVRRRCHARQKKRSF